MGAAELQSAAGRSTATGNVLMQDLTLKFLRSTRPSWQGAAPRSRGCCRSRGGRMAGADGSTGAAGRIGWVLVCL